MGKLVVTVEHPVERIDGTPFNAAVDLKHWVLFARAVGAGNWTPVGGPRPPEALTAEVGNVPRGGDWEARVEWYDHHDQTSFAVGFTDVPDPVPAPPRAGSVSVIYVD